MPLIFPTSKADDPAGEQRGARAASKDVVTLALEPFK